MSFSLLQNIYETLINYFNLIVICIFMYSRFSIIIRWLIFIRNAATLILSQLIRRNDVDSTLFTFI